MRILFVDDDAQVRRSTGRLLRHQGHEVIDASDGEAALQLYEQHRPNVVMLDLEMPGLSGEETLTRLRAHDPEAVVVVVTGHRSPADERRLRNGGACAVVHKPWRLDALLETLENAGR